MPPRGARRRAKDHAMSDSVEHLRARWTPELTAAAIHQLQGQPAGIEVPTMQHDGRTFLDLRGIRIEQTQLDGAQLRDVNLRWSTIRDVGFKGTHLAHCNLSQTSLSECYFRNTVFDNCDIVNAKFQKNEFSNARIEDCRLDFCSFKECEITLQTIRFRKDTDPRVLMRICRNLKLNAMSMGHFADAGELTYMEKTFERHTLHRHAFTAEHESLRLRLRAIRGWFGSMLLNALWGYGERPARLLVATAAAIVLFGSVQWLLDGVPDEGFGAHLYFSGITFMTIGYGDLSPKGLLPRFLAVLEGAVGISVIGMLIASWTKKIMYR
jgi:hypothetical protein